MISRMMLNLRSPSLTQQTSSNTETDVVPTTNQPCVLTVAEGPCDTNVEMQMRFPDPISTIYSKEEEGGASGM